MRKQEKKKNPITPNKLSDRRESNLSHTAQNRNIEKRQGNQQTHKHSTNT
jgi:hypothetical protein